MKRLPFILSILLLFSCEIKQSELFDDVNQMAGFGEFSEVTLIKNGKESGSFIEPLMEYGIFEIDKTDFKTLHNLVLNNEKFKEGQYYLNNELDDYLHKNNLGILNMPNCLITENKFENNYYIYLLSDEKSIAICKVNS